MGPKDAKTALVVGAGIMGHAIAQVFAQAGMDVNLVDLDDKRLERAVNLIKWNLETLALCNRVFPEDEKAILEHIHPSTDLPSAAASVDFTGLDLIFDIMKAQGSVHPIVDEKIKKGHLGVKTSKGIYDYGARSEEEILRKRDELYIKMLDYLERIHAFEPV